jgi:TadE-like protein
VSTTPAARGGGPDAGSAVVEFALVAALLTALFVGIVQLAVVVHVRNTLVDCAAEGARYAAFSDRGPSDGAARARELISGSLSPGYAEAVTSGYEDFAGYRTVVVNVRAPLPLVGLLGPGAALDVSGHAVDAAVAAADPRTAAEPAATGRGA